MNRRTTKMFASLLLLAASATLALATEPTIKVGNPAPKLATGKWMQGEPVKQFEKGKTYIVEFWATWCPPCRAEMPTLEKVYEEYKDQGLIVLGLDATDQDNLDAIAPFEKQYNLTFPILLDTNGEASALYELRSLPTSFFIGRDGVIREVVIGGPMSEALLRTNIEEIIK